jgi:hypothetical protein
MAADDSRSRSSSPYLIEELPVNLHRSVLGAWWRWRSEAAIGAGALAGFAECWHCIGLESTGYLLGGLAVGAAAQLPWPRRFLAARARVLFVRHRAFWELRLHTRAGRLPLIPWMTGTPVGVRAWVILRAGMTFEDFEDSAPAFAVACGARECRVTVSPDRSWLVFIEVIGRDVLGPAVVVPSPLADVPRVAGSASALALVPDLPGPDPDSEVPF